MNKKNRLIKLCAAILIIIAGLITILDIIIGMSLSTDSVPKTALEYFNLFNESKFIGLYYLDFLNFINVFFILSYYILIVIIIGKRTKKLATISLILSISGSILFILNNGSIDLMNLSNQYFVSNSSVTMQGYLDEAEIILTRSAHGSVSIFYGYFILSIANILLALILFKTDFIKKYVSILGLIGYGMLSIYLILITFVLELNPIIIGFAGIAGIIVLIWQFSVARKLLLMRKNQI
jgi:hypothetical protein